MVFSYKNTSEHTEEHPTETLSTQCGEETVVDAAPKAVLGGVSFTVKPGERVVVLGPNGSGKSTLARLSNGLLSPTAGTITVDGIETTDDARVRELRTTLGLVPQDPDNAIVATNVIDEVAFGPENLGLPREEIARRVDDALKQVGLFDEREREPHALSGGQKQRLVIAGILAMSPRYILFDEPTSMLDPLGVHEVRSVIESLQAGGHGILHITHDLTDLAGATRVIVLVGGKIVFEDEPLALFARPDILEMAHLEVPPLLQVARKLEAAGLSISDNPLDGEALASSLFAQTGATQVDAPKAKLTAAEESCRL